jgi:hypothetical protein
MISNINSQPQSLEATIENNRNSNSAKTSQASATQAAGINAENEEAVQRLLQKGTDTFGTNSADTSLFTDNETAEQYVQQARANILNQPQTAMAAQGNLSPDDVLQLLG